MSERATFKREHQIVIVRKRRFSYAWSRAGSNGVRRGVASTFRGAAVAALREPAGFRVDRVEATVIVQESAVKGPDDPQPLPSMLLLAAVSTEEDQ